MAVLRGSIPARGPRPAAGRDLTIRNLFIIPTVAFLIIFNVFPLIYSLGFSFTEYRVSLNKPAEFIGLQNYRELLADPGIWSNFTTTAEYVIVSVGGQMIVGFGLALLLNREIPLKGLVTTLLLLPMMLSPAVVGLFWKLLYDPSWGPINYALGIGKFEWLSHPDQRAVRGRDHRYLDVVAVRDAAVARRPVGGAASSCTKLRRSTAPAPGTRSAASPCRWSRRS